MTTRMLVAYSMSSTHVQTTLDYLQSLKQYSGYEVDYVHVTHDANVAVDFDNYDIVFHNYCSRLCFDNYVSRSYKNKLRTFKGIKVLSVQDEYNRTNTLKEAIADLGFDIVLTCVPQDSVEIIYPRKDFPNTQFVTVFTGYVPEGFANSSAGNLPISDRPILIGYRGRDIGGFYGRLGFDKFEIGRRTKEICSARGLPVDIAMDEESRIYGEAWFDFIGNCRAMLGSESGSNVFDFDGSLEAKFRAMTKTNGGRPPSYQEFEPFVAEREKEISMGQISPRVFECALMRTPMILFRGRYSDAITPFEHYLPLEKDFSNIDQILESLKDVAELEAMAERAYEHLVTSGNFGYRAFCKRLSSIIEVKRAEKSVSRKQEMTAARRSVLGETAKERILSEQATDMPGGLDELNAKLYCVALMNSLRSGRQTVTSLFDRSRQYIAAIEAHIALLEQMKSVVPGAYDVCVSTTEKLVFERVSERRVSFETRDVRRLEEFERRVKGAEWSERERVMEEAALFDLSVRNFTFFHQQLLDLHLLVSKIAQRAKTERRALRAAQFQLAALYALAKAPPRAFASGMLRRFPEARRKINQLRRLPDAT